MKIKTIQKPYSEVLSLPPAEHKLPMKPNFLLAAVMRLIAIPDLLSTKFSFTTQDLDKVKKEPCLILMNHSSFIDLMIASRILFPRTYSIVCTNDGLIGKDLPMRMLGCIPTRKFISDLSLISDMRYVLKEKKASVLMYPEASYSFDGTATPLPRKMGVLLKKLDVPVISIVTQGAFARDPLYNMLQKRKVKVNAHAKLLLTREQIDELSVKEIDNIINETFTFDNFAWQRENGIKISEDFRADGLERILYKCAACKAEGQMLGKGTKLTCSHCGKSYTLNEFGQLEADSGETEFSHIPDWYAWERKCVKEEIENGSYSIETDVNIGVIVDRKALYMVGEGHLSHNNDGFTLKGCNGELDYKQNPLASYSLYADYYWYEIGDIISIGNKDIQYYCFPKDKIPVAKARMATEELYKINKCPKISRKSE